MFFWDFGGPVCKSIFWSTYGCVLWEMRVPDSALTTRGRSHHTHQRSNSRDLLFRGSFIPNTIKLQYCTRNLQQPLPYHCRTDVSPLKLCPVYALYGLFISLYPVNCCIHNHLCNDASPLHINMGEAVCKIKMATSRPWKRPDITQKTVDFL